MENKIRKKVNKISAFRAVLFLCLMLVNFTLIKVFAQLPEPQEIESEPQTSPQKESAVQEEVIAGEKAVAQEKESGSLEIPVVEYTIAVGDVMEVFVWQNADLTKTVSVGPDGKISYPLVGRLKAVGLTIEQLENLIRERLSKYVKYPQVSVTITGYAGNKVIVLGEVLYPGVFTYKGSINLIEAIALAGDFTEKARRDCVIVARGNLTEHPKATRVNLFQAIRKGTSQTDIALQSNDVVYVPRSFIHDLNKFLQNITTTITEGRKIMDLRKDIISKAILGSTREAKD